LTGLREYKVVAKPLVTTYSTPPGPTFLFRTDTLSSICDDNTGGRPEQSQAPEEVTDNDEL
jgi:hypothetical protein